MISLSQIFTEAFASVGITVNGKQPWDIQVHNPKLYNRIISGGSIAFGEAYMDGWWDCEAVDEFLHRVLYHRLDKKLPRDLNTLFYYLNAKFKNMQDKTRAKEVAYKHYDIGNNLFEKMLDSRMMYSCAYWENANNLEEAQEAKLDLICRKLKLEKGMRILEIGCGWGGFAKYVAEKYEVSVVGITISEQQAILAREINKDLPVEIRIQDYREVNEKFDRVVSIAMLEAVGYRNFRTYMEVAAKNLEDDGIFLIHTIGGNYDAKTTDPWIDKYIFPNGMLPSASQLSKAWQGLFVLEDWHNFGTYYDPTLMQWLKKFEESWDSLKDSYDERFYRMWRYFLCASAASFRSRKNHLWHIVLTKPARLGIYDSVR
ncbi:cyclopropane fatty acyl phospholipid synthase [Pedobacter puniceum]|jgi:cyclopropane-fatty-acyl-phospholipid synthase|uniref:Cyclopropane fatty acyl phospholipid synthase n=1 Tax=Pedobacter puniceum TaxID=2666136 RepID=A0A7K0FJA4_9SPHI|nr:cyclopropane fatty acyl phospholipid synthase [Pedobacter puniceum]MRX46059.1 cyclopropane fatty acyl phospholipid synthase [Pedobacter puniceum]